MIRSILSLAVLLSAATPGTAFAPAFSRTSSSSSLSMVAIDTSDIKNGLTVELDGEPYSTSIQLDRMIYTLLPLGSNVLSRLATHKRRLERPIRSSLVAFLVFFVLITRFLVA